MNILYSAKAEFMEAQYEGTRKKTLLEAFSKGLLPQGEAAIYSSCQRLRSFLKNKGEELDFKDAFILWRGWVG